MNMQKLMQEAQRMQAQLQKTIYEGKSSNVEIEINGKYEVVKVNIDSFDSFNSDDKEMLEDMIMIAFNDAVKKVEKDKEKKMGKYGQGLAGLM